MVTDHFGDVMVFLSSNMIKVKANKISFATVHTWVSRQMSQNSFTME